MADAPATPRRVVLGVTLSLAVLLLPKPPTSAAPPVQSAPAEATIVSHALGQDFRCRRWSQGRSKLNGRWTIYLNGPLGSAEVDKQSELLTSFLWNCDLSQEAGPPHWSAEQAQARATAFLERVGVSPSGLWVLTRKRFLDHGDGGCEYDVEWRKMLHGVRLPGFIDIDVNADTGKINTYLLADDPLVAPLRTGYSKQEAVRAAVHKIGWASADCMYAELSAGGDRTSTGARVQREILQWRLCLRNAHPDPQKENYQEAVVDAATGAVFLSRYGCCPKRAFEEYQANAAALHLPPIDLKAAQREALPPTVFELARRKPQ